MAMREREPGSMLDDIQAHFDEADADGDGRIDRIEARVLVESVMRDLRRSRQSA